MSDMDQKQHKMYVGTGVGAALFYYSSERPENPAEAGATTSGWISTEHHEVLYHNSFSTYTTASEHSTSDTSIDSDSEYDDPLPMQFRSLTLSSSTGYTSGSDNSSDISSDEWFPSSSMRSDDEVSNSSQSSIDSDSVTEMDVTTSSLDVLLDESSLGQSDELTVSLVAPYSPRWNGDCPWTLELCSICYDMMLKDQKVLVLSCTHRFHQACVLDWLEEQPTCPNCRRPVRFH